MKINRLIAYLLGLLLLSFGIVLAVKANYGVTVATSPSYVLSQYFTVLSFGVFNYLMQGAVFLLTIIVLRRVKIRYLLSFLTAVIFGFTIDFFGMLMRGIQLVGHPERMLFFVLSILVIAGGLVFFYKSNMPILPFDIFVKEVSAAKEIEVSRFKLRFDLAMCSIAVVMSFLLLGELRGVSIGTLLSALLIGPVLGRMMVIFDRYITVISPKVKR